MSETALTVIVPRSIDDCASLADKLSKATTIAAEMRGNPANVMAAIMAGAELGFAPMAALRSVHMIKGIPKLSADAMVAAVLASGKAEYFEPSAYSATSVTFVTKRRGSQREQTVTWTSEDAKRAGLVSDNHRLYPRQMLAARAKSELARLVYPDILAGVYSDEEVETFSFGSPTNDPHPDAIDVESVDPDAPELAAIEAASTVEQLKALAKGLAELTGPLKVTARDRYQARLNALRTPNSVTEAVA